MILEGSVTLYVRVVSIDNTILDEQTRAFFFFFWFLLRLFLSARVGEWLGGTLKLDKPGQLADRAEMNRTEDPSDIFKIRNPRIRNPLDTSRTNHR